MMLDRLRVADLKDEIVSMQAELNSVLFEQHQKSQVIVKTEVTPSSSSTASNAIHHQLPPQLHNFQTSTQVQPQCIISPTPQPPPRIQHNIPILQEPSQILKAKQEQKLFENIKNERVKIETPEIQKDTSKVLFGFTPTCHMTASQTSPVPSQPKQSKFDKLKNESLNASENQHHHQSPHLHSPSIVNKQQQAVKPPTEMKEELDDFDIESEIRPNLIMKKCETISPSFAPTTNKKTSKQKEKERDMSPLSDYFRKLPSVGKTNKLDSVKNDTTADGAYDEWLSIQKELNLQLSGSSSGITKKKDHNPPKCNKNQSKSLENDLSEIFENHASPKSVEKQLDDLFSSNSKSSDLLVATSPLNEFFHVEPSNLGEKTVENRLEALFCGTEDDSRKSNQQDLVETRLEQLFQGSVAENDESALDNASFLYKNTDMTYEMIQKQIQVSTSVEDNGNVNPSNSNKRQWSGACDMFSTTNSSMMYPSSSSPSSKRACTAVPSVSFDNKWIEDSFDFATEMMSTESSGDDLTKHRNWNGNIEQRETMIGGVQSPHQSQFHLPAGDASNQIQQHQDHSLPQNDQHMNMVDRQGEHLMDTQLPNLNYDDVDDISRQVQNAIDSILNLQSSDPLHYQLDSSFLELNSITASSGAPSSPINIQQSHPHQTHSTQQLNQYQIHPRTDQMHGFSNQKVSNIPKRKYSRMDDIGDCLIGGSNLDDSPSALALTEPHGGESSSASVGEFVNNLLNCEEKSITTS